MSIWGHLEDEPDALETIKQALAFHESAGDQYYRSDEEQRRKSAELLDGIEYFEKLQAEFRGTPSGQPLRVR